MPYSKSPAISTYETKRVNFFQNANPRTPTGSPIVDNQRDCSLVNMMVESVPNPVQQSADVRLRSRPMVGPELVSPYLGTRGRGVYTIQRQDGTVGGISYFVVDNKVYTSFGSQIATLNTYTGSVGWAEFLSSTGQKSLILIDGVDGYIILSSSSGGFVSITKITSSNFPSPHVPNPIVLDGYLFLAKAGTNDIYNSDLDHPELWTAGNFISAEMYADNIVALAKNNNYLYAFGTDSVEFFYDAANPTGSPLARQQSAIQQMGCAIQESVIQTEKQVIFVGTTSNGNYTVWLIDGFQATEIGIPLIKNALAIEMAYNTIPNYTYRSAYVIRANNQKLYILRLTDRTFVYSFDTQMWTEWKSGTTTEINFVGAYGGEYFYADALLQKQNGAICRFINDGQYSSTSEDFMCTIVSQRLNFDTLNKKTMSRFALIGDALPDTESEVRIQWSDDDGQTWFPADLSYRTLQMSKTYSGDLPAIQQLGSFRQRSFKIKHIHKKTPFRLQGIEVNINKGIT
ncbi:Bacteriophage P22, Gp10, DNA-stabilising [uncultured Caudovirales phage]|uniref:Bacteriophage P22, Gp10, DNA-stabilising n=1 Tax=uncultured Caudovirales phage TaxID=2100421 RepID=A0A6J5LFG9_9CAUD|nr:Bacteriophage P22, Gp10, DNA-stabilising [uncultured Caudovirales phage]